MPVLPDWVIQTLQVVTIPVLALAAGKRDGPAPSAIEEVRPRAQAPDQIFAAIERGGHGRQRCL